MKYALVVYPVGYGILPYPGGWLDQPHRMVSFWNIFRDAERRSATKELS